jgi:hypothetical protein
VLPVVTVLPVVEPTLICPLNCALSTFTSNNVVASNSIAPFLPFRFMNASLVGKPPPGVSVDCNLVSPLEGKNSPLVSFRDDIRLSPLVIIISLPPVVLPLVKTCDNVFPV